MTPVSGWKTLVDLDAFAKRVFVRCDFNVPLDENRAISDDTRIRAVIPTLERLRSAGARTILASHLGRPKGAPKPEFSLAPIADHLSGLLGTNVPLAPDCIGPQAAALVDDVEPGGFLLLENLRFHAGEEKNEEDFAAALGSLAEAYVNDAFGCSHRAHASVAGIVDTLRPAVAGLLLERELRVLGELMENPQRPVAAVLGGAKVSDKLGVIESLMKRVDRVLIGGAMAYTFWKTQGHPVGNSLVEDNMLEIARALLEASDAGSCEILLPVDCVAAETMAPDAQHRTVGIDGIPDGWMGLDIGPDSLAKFGEALSDARTIVWNGPMGVFEMEPFSRGTLGMVERVTASSAQTIIGGGDTDAAVHQAGAGDQVSFISTGGGAFLKFLEGKELPGVAALKGAAQDARW